MCCMLQKIELFLAILDAVKNADIDMLRRFVNPFIIIIFSTAQYNYGHKMLFYQ